MRKKVQLFCIPYAGGMADSFHELAGLLAQKGAEIEAENVEKTEESGEGMHPDSWMIEPILLEYAGHGTRKKEAFYPGFDEMSSDIARQIQEKRDPSCPFALFGYSMGSIVVYEVLARELLDEQPCYIFAAAHEAPDIHWDCKAYEQMNDHDFMNRMITFGGFPNFDWKLMENKFFRKLYFQPIREDYRLLSIYRMKTKITLPAPATMIYSPQDIETGKIHSWDKFSSGNLEYVELGRNHFFLKEHAEELAEIIAERLIRVQ